MEEESRIHPRDQNPANSDGLPDKRSYDHESHAQNIAEHGSPARVRQERVQSDLVGIMRTSGILLLGGLVGILLVLGLFLLTRPGGAPQYGIAPGGNAPAVGAASPSGSAGALLSSAMPPSPQVGRYAPDFTLTGIDGRRVKLSSFRGKPVWINFWATWCPPCRAEMPEMKLKYEKFKGRGLVILGVDVRERAGEVEEFVNSNGFDWTFVLDGEATVSEQYLSGGIPLHVFVGRNGIIKAIQVGGLPGNLMDRYLSMIIDQ